MQVYQPVRGKIVLTDRHDVLLYVGLGIISVGLVITVVGLGDKGYQTLELQVVGPGVVGCGAVLVVVRVILCLLSGGEKDALVDCEEQSTAQEQEKEGKQIPSNCTNGVLLSENNQVCAWSESQICNWSESQPHFLICEGTSGEGKIIRMNKNIQLQTFDGMD